MPLQPTISAPQSSLDEKYVLGVDKSVTGIAWKARCSDPDAISSLIAAGLSPPLAQICAGRGVNADGSVEYLSPSIKNLLPDPSSILDMDKAAKALLDAIEAKKRICVFADYDVDGGTSAAQLIRWGREFGAAFNLYVPDRVKEGYGPSAAAFQTLKDNGIDLVVTVDCGAAATDALIAAADMDLPVIVIDHHLMGEARPPALALVNPNQPGDTSGLGYLAAAGVVFILLVALNREARRRGRNDVPNPLRLLDLTALGTICDVVPLRGLNRALVAKGLQVLDHAANPGLAALANIAGRRPPFSTYDGGFVLGPRINAGGRIGRADMGAQMLASDDLDLVESHAQALEVINKKRRAMQDDMMIEAVEQAEQLPPDHLVTMVAMKNWHPGIIGIVAGRLKEKFGRPALVIAIDELGNGKGSGRSLPGCNLGAAIHAAAKAGVILGGGGHAMAAGFTVDAGKIAEFHAFIEENLADDIYAARANPVMKLDGALSARAVNERLIVEINRAGPYGAKNPQPVFAFANLAVTYAKRLQGGHVRASFAADDGARLDGICFRAEELGVAEILLAPNPPKLHLAARLKRDEWNGRVRIDVQIADIALA